LQVVDEELVVLKQAVGAASGGVGSSTPKVPKLKAFGDARSSKELENFLWDMERYFSVAKVGLAEQVNITVMYLSSDAKLWLGTKSKEDLNVSGPKVET
jgi:hypothetical protein